MQTFSQIKSLSICCSNTSLLCSMVRLRFCPDQFSFVGKSWYPGVWVSQICFVLFCFVGSWHFHVSARISSSVYTTIAIGILIGIALILWVGSGWSDIITILSLSSQKHEVACFIKVSLTYNSVLYVSERACVHLSSEFLLGIWCGWYYCKLYRSGYNFLFLADIWECNTFLCIKPGFSDIVKLTCYF